MHIEEIARALLVRVAKPLLRQALMLLIIALLAFAAIYHLSAAGMVTLEANYGALNARLIVAAIYGALTLAACSGWWWSVRRRRTKSPPRSLPADRKAQITALVEAVVLGYDLTRKSHRAS